MQEYNKATTKLQIKERFLTPLFNRSIFICSDIITSNKVLAELEFYKLINFNVREVLFLNFC